MRRVLGPVNCQPSCSKLCPNYNRVFKNNICFQQHLKSQTIFAQSKKHKTNPKKKEITMCERIKCCLACGKLLYRTSTIKSHHCRHVHFSICKKDVRKEGMKKLLIVYSNYM